MTALTAKGLFEAQRYQHLLRRQRFDCVYTSPLKRAVKTSQIICAQSELTAVVDERLVEISYGHWNGMAIATLKRQYADYFDRETNDVRPSSVQISNGESFDHARSRLQSFLAEMAHQHPQATVLIITHGWIIKNIVALCLENSNGDAFKNPRNLSISKITIDGDSDKRRVCYYNRILKKADGG